MLADRGPLGVRYRSVLTDRPFMPTILSALSAEERLDWIWEKMELVRLARPSEPRDEGKPGAEPE